MRTTVVGGGVYPAREATASAWRARIPGFFAGALAFLAVFCFLAAVGGVFHELQPARGRGAAVVLLVLARREFYAQTQRASVAKALLTLVVGLGISVTLGYGLVRLAPGSVPPGLRFRYALQKVLGDAVQFIYANRPGHAP